MKSYIVDTFYGLFAFDENGNILSFRDFNDDDQRIIEFFDLLEKNELIEEYKGFLLELRKAGFDEYIFDNKMLEFLTSEKFGYKTVLERSSLEFKNFRLNLEERLKEIGIFKSRNQILAKYKKVSEELIKNRISLAGSQNDLIIIQVIETLDTLKKAISIFSMRLKEWYGLHFPELTDKIISDDIILAKIISILGDRENYTLEKIKESFNFKEKVIENLLRKASESMGSNIDLRLVQGYANQVLSLNSYGQELEDYLDELMKKSTPNLRAVVGSLVGAKLIAKAGNLKKLTFMPASRIQLLGAEKALYRFLKTGVKRPKHGLIFQWKHIRSSKPWIRGKISRMISGKIGLATKIDYFGGTFIGDKISNEIIEKINELEVKYPEPPKKKELKKTRPQKKSKKKKKKVLKK